MLEVRIYYTEDQGGQSLAYVSYECPQCNMNIVSFRTLHRCYNCKALGVSGGLLINSTHYRFNYHIGKVGDDGNLYTEGVK